ncbi:protein ANTAGONIST OF LIKE HETEROCHROMATIN PROTEIN 1-like [Leguminivora glycinivorella]|uniref:protein ANTAGONIST OF LIKE HETEROCHROMATIN PROTEIN 1-like n=1 Tax=Leguminivora glycinivorella TaxID=1035111 RepID=UPI00200CD775|nr:protein ANTAGONIST OF LIKE HETEROCHROMATIN PROTEIN 1-like [Leguminivora glycinivorella]
MSPSSFVLDAEAALLGLLFIVLKWKKAKASKQRKRRTVWCKQWLQKRDQLSHVNLLNELKIYPEDYRNYLRMDEKTYLKLLKTVSPYIEKQDTIMRNAISPHERLTVTLRFLATGRSYECLKFSAIISPQALGKIIPETCEAIYLALQKEYLQFPDSAEKWKDIAELFEERWNFPHCLGAIDGKHINIVPPADNGSYYYNYKKQHSMVLMAIVDAKYRFIYADFGTNGRISDGGVLQNTKFFEKLQNKTLKLPNSEILRNSSRCLPYVFVADDAFPLRNDMLKPYRQADLNSHQKKIFNYRLSRARRIVENAFGILASRFRIYHSAINVQPDNIEKIVMATCVLHNFLLEHIPSNYSPRKCFYQENTDNGTIISNGYNTTSSHMENFQRRNQGNVLSDAKRVRLEFETYFTMEGRVPWQDNFV